MEASNQKPHSRNYPAHYEEDVSVRSEINEKEIANYIQRAANTSSNRDQMFMCTGTLGCDESTVVEDCPQNQCYNQYIDPFQNDENKQRILFDKMQEILSTKISYPSEEDAVGGSLVLSCNGSNPNACDKNTTNENCPTKECYKNYIDDIKKSGVVPNRASVQTKSVEIVRQEEHKPKYNTLVVNSDVSVPDFIDVLVVISESPIKITLPTLNGPSIETTVGKVSKTSNLLIKNLSLCSHKIVANGKNKIDTVRTSVAVEPAGKKILGAVHDTWILL